MVFIARRNRELEYFRVVYTIDENGVYRVSCTVYRVLEYIHDGLQKYTIHSTYTK